MSEPVIYPVLKNVQTGEIKIVYKGKIIHTTPVETVYVEKPFPNEHAARQTDPKQYTSFARGKLPGAPAGISAIFGIKIKGGKKVSEIQPLRFDAKKWTVAAAKKWLKDHGFKSAGFEPASKPKEVKKMSTRTQSVVVHKANVPLMGDESLAAFTKELKGQAKDHIFKQFNIDAKKGGAWPVEVFADKAVFMAVPDWDKPPSNDFHVALKFTRSKEGKFEFTQTMKVKPVTTFVASDGAKVAAVTKAFGMDHWGVPQSLFAGVI